MTPNFTNIIEIEIFKKYFACFDRKKKSRISVLKKKVKRIIMDHKVDFDCCNINVYFNRQ